MNSNSLQHRFLLNGRILGLFVGTFVSLGLIGPLAWSTTYRLYPLSNVFLTLVAVSAFSAFLLSYRYRASSSPPRFYTAFAFISFSLVLAVLWFGSFLFGEVAKTELVIMQRWMLFVPRLLLAAILLLSTIALQYGDEDRYESNSLLKGWLIFLCIVCVGATFSVLFLFPFPETFSFGIWKQMQEGIPLILLLVSLLLSLREGSWLQDRFAHGRIWMYMCLSTGSVYLFLSSSRGSTLELAGVILYAIGLLVPSITMGVLMFSLYYASEQHRAQRQGSAFGTRGAKRKLVSEVFRQAVEQSHDALYIADHTGQVVFANQGFLDMTGYALGEVLGGTPDAWALATPQQQKYTQIFSEARLHRKPFMGMMRHKRKDGSTYEASVHISPIVDEFGDIAWFITREYDLTEERERMLLLQQILDNMPLGICLVQAPSTEIILSNQYANDLFRKACFDHVENFQDVYGALHLDDTTPYPKEQIPLEITLGNKEEAKQDNIEVRCIQGEDPKIPITWKMHATPLFDVKGNLSSVLVAFDDISHQKQLEHKMTDAISVASHQLRTPLTGIKWALDELRKGDEQKFSKEDRVALFDTLYDATVRMFNVVQGLLDVSKLEQGKIEIKPEPVALDTLIEEVVQEMNPRIQKKNLTVKQSNLHTIPEISIDAILVRQVIQNLIDNAIKYTGEGNEINSVLSVEKDVLHWTLHDTGIGIAREDMDRLFEKFHRGDNAQKVDAYGMGLGLFAAKSIMDLLGGEIRCESELDKGATFHVTFPIGK